MATNTPPAPNPKVKIKAAGSASKKENLLSDDNKVFMLPFKYWMPTLISAIGGAVLFMWFVYTGIVSPIKNDIMEIKSAGISHYNDNPIVPYTVFLEATDGEGLSLNQWSQIKAVVFKLKQRKDLILFIAGYTNNNLDKDQFQKVADSKKAAQRIKAILIKEGIEPDRLYCEGFGQDVPENFFNTHKENVALLVISVYDLMKGSKAGLTTQAV
jgi:hypothetical protein